MAISIGNSTSATAAYAGSMVITAPAGIEDDDILVMAVFSYTATTLPAGFADNATAKNYAGSDYLTVGWKRAASESGNYTVSGGSIAVGVLTVIKGCKTSDSPLNVAISNTGYLTSNTTIRAAALNPTAEVCLVWMAVNYAGAITVPSGFTTKIDDDYDSNYVRLGTKLEVAAGDTGVVDGTAGNTSDWKHAMMYALEPDAGGPEVLTSAKYPGTTATTNASAPYDDDDWVNIANIKVDDTSYATITSNTYDNNDYSYLAKATNFGFTIPSTATIVGLTVETLGATTAGSTAANWVMMQLLNASGAAEGDNNAADGGALNLSSDAVDTFGGAADKWGVALTPAMVNDSDFGVQFAIQAKYANTDIRVEYLKMTVYYTEAEGTTLHNLMMMGAGTA